MPTNDEPDAYQTYVLRLWRARCQGISQWRASLESPHTGERQTFATLKQLFAFLRERCGSQRPSRPPAGGERSNQQDSDGESIVQHSTSVEDGSRMLSATSVGVTQVAFLSVGVDSDGADG